MTTMMLAVNRDTLEDRLHHAAAAARIVGHLDADVLNEPLAGPGSARKREPRTDSRDHVMPNDVSMVLCDGGLR